MKTCRKQPKEKKKKKFVKRKEVGESEQLIR